MAIQGIDAAQLEAFVKQYDDSPANFTLGLEAKTIWEGRGLGNLAKVGRWSLGGAAIVKPTRDFSVQMGSWQEVGDAIGVEAADDRLEPVEAALVGLCSCVTEAIALNCARTNVGLKGLEVSAHLDVDPGPIVGAKDPVDWHESLRKVKVDVTAHGNFSAHDKAMIEEGATRSPVHSIFSRALDLQTKYHYEA
jgi:OsmC-like protein